MTSYLLAGPAIEPISLAEAKAYLRLDDSAEDALVTTLITAARLHLEGTIGRALIHQTWRLVLDGWPADTLRLPVAPLSSLVSVTAYDTADDDHDIALAQFSSEADPARLLLPAIIEGMPGLRARQGIAIDYVAGYGDAGDDVPADLRQALLKLIGYWFEHRDAVAGAGAESWVPAGFERLVSPYRSVRL